MTSATLKIANSVKRILEDTQRTQGWLAGQVQMTAPQLSNYLSGKVKLPLDKAEEIAKALGVELSDLLSGLASPTEEQLMAIIITRSRLPEDIKSDLLAILEPKKKSAT